MKATGKWNYDITKAPKDGHILLLRMSQNYVITGVWSKYTVTRDPTIMVQCEGNQQVTNHEGWVSNVSDGLIIQETPIAWAFINLPKYEDILNEKEKKG